MLVIQRNCGESVFIGRSEATMAAGEFVEVTLVRTASGKAHLGFDAPGSVRILREELLQEFCTKHGTTMPTEPRRNPLADEDRPDAKLAG